MLELRNVVVVSPEISAGGGGGVNPRFVLGMGLCKASPNATNNNDQGRPSSKPLLFTLPITLSFFRVGAMV